MRSLFHRRPEIRPVANWRLGVSDVMFAGVLALLTVNTFLPHDRGIGEAYKPYYFDTLVVVQVPARNVMHVDVVSGGILLDKRSIQHTELRRKLVDWFWYAQFFDTTTVKYVSLRSDREALYADYIAARDAILFARNELLDELAIRRFGRPYGTDMPLEDRTDLRGILRIKSVEEQKVNLNGKEEYWTF